MNFALSLLSAFLLVMLFPRYNLTWLAPVALTPLLVACAHESSWRNRLLNGWGAGFVFWFAVCYWIQFVLEVHGGMGRWGGWGTFVLFAALKGLHLAVFACLAGFLMPKFWAIPAIAAVLGISAITVRWHLSMGRHELAGALRGYLGDPNEKD